MGMHGKLIASNTPIDLNERNNGSASAFWSLIWYISFPFSDNVQRQMTKSQVQRKREHTMENFNFSFLVWALFLSIQFPDSSDSL